MNNETTYDRMERLNEVLTRVRQLQDAFPPGLRETIAAIDEALPPGLREHFAAIDRVTAPTRALLQTIPRSLQGNYFSAGPPGIQVTTAPASAERTDAGPVLPAPSMAAVPCRPVRPPMNEAPAAPAPSACVPSVVDRAADEANHLASELVAVAETEGAAETAIGAGTTRARAALERLAALLGLPPAYGTQGKTAKRRRPTVKELEEATPAVAILPLRPRGSMARWTTAHRQAFLAQVEGHPAWTQPRMKYLAYAAVEKAWGVGESVRKRVLKEARDERKRRLR